MLILALLACASQGPTPGPSLRDSEGDPASTGEAAADDRHVFVNTHDVIAAESAYEAMGPMLMSGMDLDHDGVLEWATAVPPPNGYSGPSKLTVFEGASRLTERVLDDDGSLVFLGAFDATGDGYPDLLSRVNLVDWRIQVLGGVTPDTDAYVALQAPGEAWDAMPISLDDHPDGTSVLIGWWLPATAITSGSLPTATGSDVDPAVVPMDDVLLDDRARESEDVTEATSFSSLRIIQEPDGEPTHFLVGTDTRGIEMDAPIAVLRICPLHGSIGLADCTPVPVDEPLGEKVMPVDLDGDGVQELVAKSFGERFSPGALWIFERDGSWRATIRGLGENQFAGHFTFVVDDAGEGWLLVGNRVSFDTIYAFRTDGLSGELTSDDADRVYVDPGGSTFTGMAPYRETPDGPLWLLVGAGQQVFRRPFEP